MLRRLNPHVVEGKNKLSEIISTVVLDTPVGRDPKENGDKTIYFFTQTDSYLCRPCPCKVWTDDGRVTCKHRRIHKGVDQFSFFKLFF